MRAAIAAISATFGGTALPAQQPAELAPAGGWSVDFADTGCIAQRTFGTGDDAITIGVQPAPRTKQAALIVLARKGLSGDGGRAPVRMDLAGATTELYGWRAITNAGTSLIRLPLQRMHYAQFRDARDVTLTFGKRSAVRFQPGFGRMLTETLARCETDLLKSWGVDVDALPALEDVDLNGLPPVGADALSDEPAAPDTSAGPDLSSWIRPEDYPAAAIRGNQEATLAVLLLIDPETGIISDCKGTLLSGLPGWERIACNLVKKRGRYTPFPNRSGPVVKALIFSFRLPD